jgi:hypothetical protein
MNFSTLERRLQSLMKQFQNNRNQNLSHHNPHVGIMIPTPGLQPSGNVTAMIPTPGTDVSMVNCPGTSTVVPNTAGTGNMLPNSNENTSLLQGNSILATDNNSSKMVPTPGLSNAFPISGDNMSSLPGQQQVQPHKSHVIDHSPQRNFQLPRGNLIQQYSQQLQQSHQQNMQYQPQQQQQYQQQHHNHQENQQSQHQQQLLLKSEDVQQIQMTSKLSGQKHLGIGLQHQNEALQHHIPQASNEQLQPQVTGVQIQPSHSGGLLMHQDSPNSQQLCRQPSQKSQQQQVPSPQQQQQSQSQNDSNSFPTEIQPEVVLQGLQESQSQEKFQVPEQVAHSEDHQQPQQEVEQSMAIQDDAQNAEQPHQSSVSGTVSTVTNPTRVETSSGATGSTGQPSTVAESRQQHISNNNVGCSFCVMLVNVLLLKANATQYIVQLHNGYGHTLQSAVILNVLILGVKHLGLLYGTIKIVVTYIALFVVLFVKS